ncbi:polysaccharide pyruvyl transferase family protein [Tenuifilum osseticum]|uniref:polysaccharide pyruvyl transferase family protein n=1 Tax=Tenuifilum osseticum TaxID=3374723 RepID=UPI0034E4CFF1
MELILLGYYGYNNFGDDLMLSCLVNELKEISNINIHVFVRFKKNFFLNEKNNCNVNVHYFYENSMFRNVINFIKISFKSKFVIWGGGTCFSDQDGVDIRYFLLSKFLLCKIGYIGIGVGKVTGFRKFKMLFILSLSSLITVRDSLSYNTLYKFKFLRKKLIKTADISFLYDYNKLNPKNEYILISLHNLLRYTTIERIYLRRLSLIDFISNNYNNEIIYILPLADVDYEENLTFYNHLLSKFKNVFFLNLKNYEDKIKYIQNAKIYYTERLHGYIVSKLYNNILTIPLNYSNKFQHFRNETGINYEGIELNNIQNLRNYVLNNKNIINNNKIKELKNLAKQNIIALKNVFNK